MEVVNIKDKEYYDNNYQVFSLGFSQFKVYCNTDTGAALEAIGEYCKKKGYNGHLGFDYEKLMNDCDNNESIFDENWYPVNGGEYYLNIMGMHVSDFMND